VIFGAVYLRPVISIVTFTKGVVLCIMVCDTMRGLLRIFKLYFRQVFVTGIISAAADVNYTSEWVYIGQPLLSMLFSNSLCIRFSKSRAIFFFFFLLVGTVALGGGGNVVPIILAKVRHTRKEIRRNTIVLFLLY
jgi:hypothetical protein